MCMFSLPSISISLEQIFCHTFILVVLQICFCIKNYFNTNISSAFQDHLFVLNTCNADKNIETKRNRFYVQDKYK